MNTLSSKKTYILIFSLIFIVYVLSFIIMPKNAFFVSDNGCKFIQMKSLILSDYKDMAINAPGLSIVPSFKFCPFVLPFFVEINQKIYSVFSITFAFLSSFPYKIFGMAGLYIIPLISFFIMLPAIWLITGLLSEARIVRPISLLFAVFCTPVWFYSLTFWEHVPAATFVIWGLYYFFKFILKNKIKDLQISAVFLGVSIYFRDNLIILPIVISMILLLFHKNKLKNIIRFGFFYTITVSPLFVFQWIILGNPLGAHVTSVSAVHSGLIGYITDRFKIINRLLFNSHNNLWLSIPVNVVFFVLLFSFPRLKKQWGDKTAIFLGCVAIANGVTVFSGYYSNMYSLSYLGFSNGLFGIAPLLIFSLFRMSKSEYSPEMNTLYNTLRWFIVLCLSIYILLVPWEHSRGLHWGCRYLFILYPILAILSANNIVYLWNIYSKNSAFMIFRKSCITFVVFLSLFFQIYSLNLIYTRKTNLISLNKDVIKKSSDIIVTNIFFTAFNLAPNFFDFKIYFSTGKDKEILFNKLKKNGINEITLFFYPKDQDLIQGKKIVYRNLSFCYPMYLQQLKL